MALGVSFHCYSHIPPGSLVLLVGLLEAAFAHESYMHI